MDAFMNTRSRVIAFAMTMAMAFALTLVIAPSAFAVDWNDNVTVTAMGGNNGQTATYDTETGVISITPGTGKTEVGQYVDVTMQFTSAQDFSSLTGTTAEAYLQANTTIAGRSLNGSDYNRDIYDVVVDDTNDKITFKIGFNQAWNSATGAFYTTANYNGKLNIAANSTANSTIAAAMGGNAVETLIGTGVAISNNDGVLSNNDTTKTFTISSAAYNRGMVHVLIKDGTNAVFNGTGTFSNGGLTVHAHTFTTQTVSDFASLIASTA